MGGSSKTPSRKLPLRLRQRLQILKAAPHGIFHRHDVPERLAHRDESAIADSAQTGKHILGIDATGFINVVFDKHFAGTLDASVLIAGSPRMMQEAVKVAISKGIPAGQIRHDPIQVAP